MVPSVDVKYGEVPADLDRGIASSGLPGKHAQAQVRAMNT